MLKLKSPEEVQMATLKMQSEKASGLGGLSTDFNKNCQSIFSPKLGEDFSVLK